MDRLSAGRGKKGSRHKEAYVRFRALEAAIVRIVQSRDTRQSKIDWFLTVREKKVWKAFSEFWIRGRTMERGG